MKLLPSDHLTCRDTVILIVLSFLIIVLPFAFYHGSFDDANVCHRSLLLDDVLSLLLSDVIVTGSMARPVVEVKTMTLAAQWCCNLKCIKSCFSLGKGSSATVARLI